MNTTDYYEKIQKIQVHKTSEFRYQKFTAISNQIFSQENSLEIIVELSEKLAGIPTELLLLQSLPHFMNFTFDHYQKLYQLLENKELAVYRISRFLLTYGNASMEQLASFGMDSNITIPKPVHLFLSNSQTTDEHTKLKMLCAMQNVSLTDVLAFQKKLATYK
ncbi:hypothetical protein IW492_06550 [Enterococcus sp. BWB1-3]|uniref:hypothetical protein n=1 Tax=unclassified Enterococcus TaxID=2608891 RepID=UPI001920E250|nr:MULTISPECIES: hypothetical protein [unclassified Enterococcus]MBL1228892.1 hypothetical protein [Enterococcus sp. BWB1-3]MCB5951565.1 hypothetical protein [Enterococcus sp. BWT-B8]MCB5954657.1 hypothetical protein [Enterococcus sp. CWB-B31]